jgi:hypothetical protein
LSDLDVDVLQSGAVALLLQLEAEGFEVAASGDRVKVKPSPRLTPKRRADLERYRYELLVLLRVCDDGVQDRREAFARLLAAADDVVPTLVFRAGTSCVPGVCYSCASALPHPRHGRCWRCALAARLACGAPISPALAGEYDHARIA